MSKLDIIEEGTLMIDENKQGRITWRKKATDLFSFGNLSKFSFSGQMCFNKISIVSDLTLEYDSKILRPV